VTDTASGTSPAEGEGALPPAAGQLPPRAEERGVARAVMIGGTLAAVLLSINQLFNLQLFGLVLIEGLYDRAAWGRGLGGEIRVGD